VNVVQYYEYAAASESMAPLAGLPGSGAKNDGPLRHN
jgi:hypothetical protein